MEKLTIEDIKKVHDCAGTSVREPERTELKIIYSKLEFICLSLPRDKFNYKIRKDPRSQGGGFKYFQNYLWAKIYPVEFQNHVLDKLAFIIGISDGTLHFHIMGIGEYQDKEVSQKVHTNSWTELNLDFLDYDFIIHEFEKFYEVNRNSYICAAAGLGITFFKDLVNKMEIIDRIKLLEYKNQIILQGPPGTGKTREAELIAKEMIGVEDVKDLQDNEQSKLIQFHPSYTYEDFVRGIVAESKGEKIEYKNINKALGKFAEVALQNYQDSKKEVSQISKEKWIDEQFDYFVEKIAEDLNNEKYFILTDNVNIVDLEEDAFLYIGATWKGYEHRMLFKDIKKAYFDGNSIRKDLSHNMNISGSARQHATYYVLILQAFLKFIKDKTIPEIDTLKVVEKPYILIIDEINRANLSSVLGELIYALEYRGKAVDSMYAVEDSTLQNKNQIILPPNLYIIGTMNTADRSVGHIDYAIRRRFAFVNVLPKELADDEKNIFNKDIFKIVSGLFIKNYDEYMNDRNIDLMPADTLFSDFQPQDVWIGHSYFIQKKDKNDKGEEILIPEKFSTRIQYEIIPILEEYIKDGILKESAREVIKTLKANAESA